MATSTTKKVRKGAKTSAAVQKKKEKRAQMLWNKMEWKRVQWRRHSFYGWLSNLGVQLDGEDAPAARERLFPFIEEGDVSMANERGVPMFPEDIEKKQAGAAKEKHAKENAKKKEVSTKNVENEEEASESSTKSSSPTKASSDKKNSATEEAKTDSKKDSKKQPVLVLSEEDGDEEEEKLFEEMRAKLNYPESKSREQFTNDLKTNKKLRARFEKLLAERKGENSTPKSGEKPSAGGAKPAEEKSTAQPTPTRKTAVCDEAKRRKQKTPLPTVSWHKDLAKLDTYDYRGPIVNYKGFAEDVIAA